MTKSQKKKKYFKTIEYRREEAIAILTDLITELKDSICPVEAINFLESAKYIF